MTEETQFGFERVLSEEKTRRVKDVFRRVAQSYDLMNDFMSLGIHRLWKDHMVWQLTLKENDHVLDVAGGTGDIAFRLAKAYPHLNLNITVCDLTSQMIEIGRDRAINKGLVQGVGENHGIKWVCGNAENLPISDSSVDLYTIAYGLRNVTHIDKALLEAYRVLKPGGQFICLEFSHVKGITLERLYELYSFQVLPLLGQYVANDRAAYQYLVESIAKFPNQESLAGMIELAGFTRVHWQNLCGGISCIHTTVKT